MIPRVVGVIPEIRLLPHLDTSPFPQPSADELAHSAALCDLIRSEIRSHGSIPFWRFMELALYAPGFGYYSAGKTKFGASGDFITAPELGHLFARCVARATASILRAGEETEFIEVGGGSGTFAVAALAEWERLGCLPRRYRILDRSAELRARQHALLEAKLPHLLDRVDWPDTPPEQPWRGVLFANEVIDALPVHRFVMRDGEPRELHVGLDAEARFIEREREADTMLIGAIAALQQDLLAPLPEGYRSEVLPQLPWWIDAICGQLDAGLAVFVDYGYPRREYYLPERDDGTLICHYHHRAHGDALRWPGLQDITSFVDFTALALAGTHARLPLAGFNAQASFLIAAGILDMVEEATHLSEIERYRLAQEVKRLTLPGEMGERFKVMSFARGIDQVPEPFTRYDQSRRL
ncbi:MAG TPA: SAM-dependent methyltransferase [Patescibacteria group bacterium]|nr:SAM-dependent methyltransferase [Patescibacteria group bacterium]